MKKPVTILKCATNNNSIFIEDDRLSDKFSDKFSMQERWSDRISMPDSNRGSLDRLRSFNF
jgi:hypothetical protein